MSTDPIIYLIDSDVDGRACVEQKLTEIQLEYRSFGDTASLLAEIDPMRFGCVLTELKIGGMTAFQLVKQLRQRNSQQPVVLMSAHATVPLTVQAFKAGMFEVLEKPSDPFQLWDCMTRAFECHSRVLDEARRNHAIHNRFAQLSQQELQVLQMVLDGQPNKRIAAKLGISPRTIVFRRKSVMQKLNARSVADLAFLAHFATQTNGHGTNGHAANGHQAPGLSVPLVDIASIFRTTETPSDWPSAVRG
jgi:two-component system response regulator FixJ